VTSKTTATLRTQAAPYARLLAFVLLVLIAYTTTVEAAHNHDNLAFNRADSTASAISNSSDADSSLKESQAYGDCLICQLQQHLSTTLFSTPPRIILQQTETTQTLAPEVSYPSHPNTPRRGRAPPIPSLV
jgi:uncharacterized membrane protein